MIAVLRIPSMVYHHQKVVIQIMGSFWTLVVVNKE